jgi:hypothetical protein
MTDEAPWRRDAHDGDGPADDGTTYKTLTPVFDGISRHTREGYAFQQRAAEVGFRQAVRERDSAPYDDAGPSTNKG